MMRICWLLLMLLLCLACGETDKPVTADTAMRLVAEAAWPLIEDDMSLESLKAAAIASLDYMDSRPLEQEFIFGPRKCTAKQLGAGWRRVLELRAQHAQAADFTKALKQEFDLYQAVGQDNNNGQVLFTGYYEPIIAGRLTQEKAFGHPLYALPDDLFVIELADFDPQLPNRRLVGRAVDHKLKPYPSREQIDFQGAIKDSAKVLAWIADPVEAFFMHVQGSGKIELADGSHIRLGYAGANGQPYRSIGNMLIKQGHMQASGMSMQNIRQYLADHPELLREVLSYNPSYVFFRQLPISGGPVGAYARPVSDGRSIACDSSLFPPMALAFISGSTPLAEGNGPLHRLVWVQDTGGAIKGPGRLDLFYGSGTDAGLLAGRMKNLGQLYFLVPKISFAPAN